jgi:hypothetical protein
MLNFEEISCKFIKLRKILNSDIDDIKDVRRKGESEGFLTKLQMIFKFFLNGWRMNQMIQQLST